MPISKINVHSSLLRGFTVLILSLCAFYGYARSEKYVDDMDTIGVEAWNGAVKGYNWFEHIFNNYDTTYVKPVPGRFKVKLYTNNWLENYRLNFTEGGHMNLRSDIVTNIGLELSYWIVSLSYEMNLNKYYDGYERHQKRFNLGLHTALINFDVFVENNDLTALMTSFNTPVIIYPEQVRFDGVKTDRWGIEAYYFLNNRHYSQPAAFDYTRLQTRSQGSFYFGMAYRDQKYRFDFSTLPSEITGNLPEELENYTYQAHTHDFFLIPGYGFNWVLGKHWMIAISESPFIGFRTGRVNIIEKNRFNLTNLIRVGGVYNLRRFFTGLQGSLYTNLTKDPEIAMWGNILKTELSVGYRF